MRSLLLPSKPKRVSLYPRVDDLVPSSSSVSDKHKNNQNKPPRQQQPPAQAPAPSAAPRPTEFECDFFRNPTTLSRLILFQKYVSAIRRVKTFPVEASTWVSSTREQGSAIPQPVDDGERETEERQLDPTNNIANQTICSTDDISYLTESLYSNGTCSGYSSSENRNGPAKASTPDRPVESSAMNHHSAAAAAVAVPGHTQPQQQPQQKTNTYSIRQLPLHMACRALATCQDAVLRTQLEQLIGQLLVTFPTAGQYRDHEQRLPLHEAIWYHASPNTIIFLLVAYAHGVDELDKYGRTVLELNQHRPALTGSTKEDDEAHRAEIGRILLRKKSFWQLSQQEANLRRKLKHIPEEDATIHSDSVLLDISLAGDYSLVTQESEGRRAATGYVPPMPLRSAASFAQHQQDTAWSQLETRALNLERSLAESFEQNYAMAHQLKELEAIAKRYREFISSNTMAQRVVQLEKEKTDLQQQVSAMDLLLKRNSLSIDDSSVYTKPSHVEVEKAGITPPHTTTVEQESNKANDELIQLRQENFRLKARVDLLTIRMNDYQKIVEQFETAKAAEAADAAMDETNMAQTATAANSMAAETSMAEKDKVLVEDVSPTVSSTTDDTDSSNIHVRVVVEQNQEPIDFDDDSDAQTVDFESLAQLARTMYGHTFSPELIEAWRNLDLTSFETDEVDENTSQCWSALGGANTILGELLEGEAEDEDDSNSSAETKDQGVDTSQ